MGGNIVDSDQTPRPVVAVLGLHCLLRPISPHIYDKYGIENKNEFSRQKGKWIKMLSPFIQIMDKQKSRILWKHE